MKQLYRDNWLYAVVWIFVYTSSLLYMWYADIVNDFDFRWERVIEAWTFTTAYLLLFLIHHFVIVPRLFQKKRYIGYAVSIALCLTLFMAQLMSHDHKPMKHMGYDNRHRMHIQKDCRRTDDIKPRHPKKMLAPPDMARMVIALMMIGIDLGCIAWINSQKLRQRLLLLEKQNLKQELEHLKYQINPHFFMNTLNNIHVLVDIDQERAKRAIIELSGLMRHSLYNGDKVLTDLQNEIEFLRQYISLMQLRFGNRIAVTTDLPDVPSTIKIPTLLLATFIENAFKHGISYHEKSFIDIILKVNSEKNTIWFKCENSRPEISSATRDGYHGIGLNNVLKRLDLQYGNDYSLSINTDNPRGFVVELTLPVTTNHKNQQT